MNLVRNITGNQGFHSITPKAIVIHWWDDPSKRPTLEGVVSWFHNPESEVSAHYVVSGNIVVQMVDENQRAWHAMSANDYAIGIEVDPRVPDGTYDTTAELIRNIWSRYGRLPIMRHRDVPGVSTNCPGTLDVELIIRKAQGGDTPMLDENYLRAFWLDLFEIEPTAAQKKQFIGKPALEVYNELRNSNARKEWLAALARVRQEAKDAKVNAAKVKELEEKVVSKLDELLAKVN